MAAVSPKIAEEKFVAVVEHQRRMVDQLRQLEGFAVYVVERWRWPPWEMAQAEVYLDKQLRAAAASRPTERRRKDGRADRHR